MKEINFEILRNNKIADNIYEMRLSDHGAGHGITRPGQFVNIRLDGFFLRRPISVCKWEKDLITLVYKVVGAGTEAMSKMMRWQRLNILTPLGNGFDTELSDIGQRPLLIGGGAGVPPMYGLCKELIARGKSPVAVLGFNSGNECFYTKEFKWLGVETIVTTADGSAGMKGFVTDVIDSLDYTYLFACGPEPMLKALDERIDPEIGGQLSFEERMGCGFGACMGCSCETKYGSKRICKEGPVLTRGEIIW